MKKRIIKKWKKRGIYDEMMKKHQARRGGPSPERWTSRFIAEGYIRDKYLQIQSTDSRNPLLKYCALDEHNHVRINPIFYQEYFSERDFQTEGYDINVKPVRGKKVVPSSAIIKLEGMLIRELKFLSQCRVLSESEVEIRPIRDKCLIQEPIAK